jgi:hypothetical protein
MQMAVLGRLPFQAASRGLKLFEPVFFGIVAVRPASHLQVTVSTEMLTFA